jgi:threonine dehydrogenase-like Zn-dependent dehydrogenase
MRSYGAAETIDHTAVPAADAVRRAHPDGIDVLIDVASDADGFAALASLVSSGGTALTTRYVADADALNARGVAGVNFRVQMSSEVLEQLAADVVAGRIVVPPITKIELADVLSVMHDEATHPDGKTVITL